MGWLEDKKAKEQIEKILFGTRMTPDRSKTGAIKANVNNDSKGLKPYQQVAFNQVFSFNPESRTT